MGKFAATAWRPDLYGTGKSWGHSWEPRTKTITAFIYMVGVVSLNSLPLALGALALALTAALSMGFPLLFLAGRLLWGTPFLLLMAVTISLGGGLPPAMERLILAGLVVSKALTSLLVMAVLLGTQPVEKYFAGLAHLGLPPVIVSTLFLAYRYLFLFREQVASTQRALAARLFQPGASRRALPVYGEVAGGLLLKAIDRSETVYRAMTARGFTGQLPTGEPAPITGRDLAKSGLAVLLTMGLLALDWRWVL